ncbi:Enoyl-(Acyl carrier protein) reductase [Cyclobacterium xiamenense]|uniref:Enoyl-(Acyl carrier protein) reductase n=1 Tax=Cyclobacterium xiamenense TaxID=1297121 RepID=A0A1H6UCJ4_9BACT|nr:SDR family oxidoreductase [Cyclobacterium xiamenense]SEI88364.1 Enoyl-(Acyl carrier protein) reductase [Cyclobacterium xiamenense]
MKTQQRLKNRVVLITRGESQFAGVLSRKFAQNGADVLLCASEKNADCLKNKRAVEQENRHCELVTGDLLQPGFCQEVAFRVHSKFGKIDFLINNSLAPTIPAEGVPVALWKKLQEVSSLKMYSFQELTESLIPFFKTGGKIINNQHFIAGPGYLPEKEIHKKHLQSVRILTAFFANRYRDKGILAHGVLFRQNDAGKQNPGDNAWGSLPEAFTESECPFLQLATGTHRMENGSVVAISGLLPA